MAEQKNLLLLGGLGLAGFAAWGLSQKPPPAPGPPPPAPVPPPPAPQPAAGYQVTAQLGVIVRAGPGTQYPSRGLLPYGTVVSIDCQTRGTAVMGSSVWDRITGPIAGYVSDYWISTPTVGGFSPGLAVCGGTPPPPPPGGLPPTGKPAIADQRQLSAGMVISDGCGWGNADYVIYYNTPPYQYRRWVMDYPTWQKLGIPRSAIRICTIDLIKSIPEGPWLQWAPGASSAGPTGFWRLNPSGAVDPQPPPPLIASPGGWC